MTILTDSSKFNSVSLVHQLDFADINQVITDKGIPQAAQQALEDADVKVTIV